jgi:hypothetical protein
LGALIYPSFKYCSSKTSKIIVFFISLLYWYSTRSIPEPRFHSHIVEACGLIKNIFRKHIPNTSSTPSRTTTLITQSSRHSATSTMTMDGWGNRIFSSSCPLPCPLSQVEYQAKKKGGEYQENKFQLNTKYEKRNKQLPNDF